MPTTGGANTKTSLRKVRTLWHCSRLRAWRFTYDWSWWYPSGKWADCNRIWKSCRALVMVSSSIRLTAWLQNSKKRAERSEIDVWAESPRLSPLWLSASSACHGLLIIAINAVPRSARQNARELKLANAAITDMQMRQRDVAALDAKNTRVSWC